MVFSSQRVFLPDCPGVALLADHRQANLLLVQDVAVANCPDVGRAKVGFTPKPLILVHEGFAYLAQLHFLFHWREPNQNPMMPPSMAISSLEKIRSE